MDNKIESNIRINNTNDNKINIDNRLRSKQLHQSPNKIRQEPKKNINNSIINPLASPGEGAPALKYGDVNIVTPSPGEVKGLIH